MTASRRSEKAGEPAGGSGFEAASAPPPVMAPTGGGKGVGKGKRVRLAPSEGDLQAAAAAEAQAPGGLGPDAPTPMAIDSAPSTSGRGPIPLADVKLPLDLNTRVNCKWKDGNYYACRILERRRAPDWEGPQDDPGAWEYYVHYHRMNRRMDDWVPTSALDLSTVEPEVIELGPDGKPKKKSRVEEHSSDEEHGDFDPQQLREHEEFTKVKNIDVIQLGQHEMHTWYFSPFPPEYNGCKKLYFCEYSLHFFKRRSQLLRHLSKCKVRHPPGEEIYRKDNISMFEIDGRKEKQFCQNLCYLAKLFLDHKTLYYDVDLFLFYVLCETDSRGAHIVGYFSKEKASEEGYNLACILALPAYQRKGYGKLLISFSYELSKLEGKVGTPERPLSDLGLVSYRGYWTRQLLPLLMAREGAVSIKELSEATRIRPDDIITTLNFLNLVQYQKGQHVICAPPDLLAKLLAEAGHPGHEVDASRIVWSKYQADKELERYRP